MNHNPWITPTDQRPDAASLTFPGRYWLKAKHVLLFWLVIAAGGAVLGQLLKNSGIEQTFLAPVAAVFLATVGVLFSPVALIILIPGFFTYTACFLLYDRYRHVTKRLHRGILEAVIFLSPLYGYLFIYVLDKTTP